MCTGLPSKSLKSLKPNIISGDRPSHIPRISFDGYVTTIFLGQMILGSVPIKALIGSSSDLLIGSTGFNHLVGAYISNNILSPGTRLTKKF